MNTENREPSHRECFDMLDKLTRATDALHYLNTLLDLAVNSAPECLADQHSGLARLMGRQLDDIGDVVDPLRAYVKRREEEQLAQAAAPGQLPEGWITPPVVRSVHDLPPEHPARNPLRGADLEAVARDTNLAESTVRRVVERLLAEPDGDPRPAVSNG